MEVDEVMTSTSLFHRCDCFGMATLVIVTIDSCPFESKNEMSHTDR